MTLVLDHACSVMNSVVRICILVSLAPRYDPTIVMEFDNPITDIMLLPQYASEEINTTDILALVITRRR